MKNSERRVVACDNEGCVNLYKWDEEECYSTVFSFSIIRHLNPAFVSFLAHTAPKNPAPTIKKSYLAIYNN